MGNGRSDIAIYQKDRPQNAVIIELKVCRNDEFLENSAKKALAQINEKRYYAEAVRKGYKNILKYGVTFKDKVCYAVVE